MAISITSNRFTYPVVERISSAFQPQGSCSSSARRVGAAKRVHARHEARKRFLQRQQQQRLLRQEEHLQVLGKKKMASTVGILRRPKLYRKLS